ncbi:MAG: outer membrane beta-barrel protein [Pseudomonadota bacterium]
MSVGKNIVRFGVVLTFVVGGAAAGLSSQAAAEASDYNYLQAAYINGDVLDEDVDGWQLDGSFRLGRSLFVAGRYSEMSLDQNGSERLDNDTGSISLGYIFGANETASVYGTVGARKEKFRYRTEMSSSSLSEEGYELGLGARINLSREAELKVAVHYVDLGNNLEMTVPSAELVYSFTPDLAGVVNYEEEDDFSKVGLGVRFHF